MALYKGTTLIAGSGISSALFNSKAEVNFSNVNDTAKIMMANASMPSATYETLSDFANGAEMQAPADGWFVFGKTATAANQYLGLRNQTNGIEAAACSVASGNIYYLTVPVLKGQKVLIYYNFGGSTTLSRFVYAQGSISEAS